MVTASKLTIFKNERDGFNDFDFSLWDTGVGESLRLDELPFWWCLVAPFIDPTELSLLICSRRDWGDSQSVESPSALAASDSGPRS